MLNNFTIARLRASSDIADMHALPTNKILETIKVSLNVLSSLDITPIGATPEATEKLAEKMKSPTTVKTHKRKEPQKETSGKEVSKRQKVTYMTGAFFSPHESVPEEGPSCPDNSHVLYQGSPRGYASK